MALVRCPHCGVDTPDRQISCYFCHKPRHEKPSLLEAAKASTDPLAEPIQTPQPVHLPSQGVSDAQVYRNWWYCFLGLLVFLTIVAGADGEKSPGDFIGFGILYSLMIAILVLIACGPIVWIIRMVTGTKWHALAPAVATGLVLIAVMAGLGGHFFEGGGDECMDSGRYGENSSC